MSYVEIWLRASLRWRCAFQKHCHEVTGFLLWFGTYCISCVVQQRSRVKDLFSLMGYYDSCLAAIRHDKSIIRVLQPHPDICSQSVLFWLRSLGDNFLNSLSFRKLFWNIYAKLFLSLWDILRTKRTVCCETIVLNTKTGKYVTTWALPPASSLIFDEICAEQHGWAEDNKNEFQFGSICGSFQRFTEFFLWEFIITWTKNSSQLDCKTVHIFA